MLYSVSYSNGIVGVFSSMDKIKECVFDLFPSITFIIQVFKNSENIELIEGKHMIWIVMYKNTETVAYITDNKEEANKTVNILDKIGKSYEDSIEYWEQEINIIPDCVFIILDALQNVYKGAIIDSSDNIIYYT
jgi:hypothetical protein